MKKLIRFFFYKFRKTFRDLDFKISIYIDLRNNFCNNRLFYFDTKTHFIFYALCLFLFEFSLVFWILDIFRIINLDINWYFSYFIHFNINFIGFGWFLGRVILLVVFLFSEDYAYLEYRIGWVLCLFLYNLDLMINLIMFLLIYIYI